MISVVGGTFGCQYVHYLNKLNKTHLTVPNIFYKQPRVWQSCSRMHLRTCNLNPLLQKLAAETNQRCLNSNFRNATMLQAKQRIERPRVKKR